jgi:hypothetical protein
VAPNAELATRLIEQGRAHLTSAGTVVDTDPTGAFVLAYDGARKALAAILVNQGLRAGGDGSHAVLLDVVLAQLDPPLGAIFKPFTWMRPLRNHTEYPSPDYPVAQPVDVAEAIPAAAKMIDVAATVIGQMPTY